MRHCFSLLVILHLSCAALSQTAASSTIVSKPVIDSAAITDWADLLWSEPSITPNGKYFMYPIDNLPVGGKTLVVQSTEGEWKKEFVGAEKGFFSGDSKKAIFKNGDSLYLLSVGKEKLMCIGNVASYKNPKEGAGQWLAYLTKTNELTVYNLVTDKKQQYSNVWEYQFDNSGQVLLMKEKIKKDSTTSESVEWLTLASSKRHTVWQSEDNKISTAKGFSFDEGGKQLAFIVENKSKGQLTNAVWYYREGERATEKVTNETPGIDSGMILTGSAPSFSKNGKYIFFKITPVPVPQPKPDPNSVQVDVWSYKDMVMQNIQLYNVKNPNIPSAMEIKDELKVVITVEGEKAIPFEKSGFVNLFFTGPGDYAVLERKKYIGDKLWLSEPKLYNILSLKDGTLKTLSSGNLDNFYFSPDGTYLIYYDQSQRNFFSYDFITSKTKNISSSISEPITLDNDKDSKYEVTKPLGIKGWLSPYSVIIYGKYDIWQVDITGNKQPINLTNGYGKKRTIKFRILDEKNLDKGFLYFANRPLLLISFDTRTKQNGFYRVYSGKAQDPEQLRIESYLFCVNSYQSFIGLLDMKPVKANKTDSWIVKRQSSTEAPNFFITKDFKTFRQLTNLQPQKKYNWFTSELLTWKQPDGEYSQGILYKPDNFDSTRKYPVIINYYEKLSDGLNQFRRPEFIGANLNIPWFVSRGYLVFTPDIYYTIGKAGESVVNSVVSGTKYLFQLPFVDSTKVGIQGHSWGGYETNYLVTHTNIFAAAVDGAGPTDFISGYGTLLQDGSANNGYQILQYEKAGSQNRLQTTLWENPEVYIENSPIFNAHNIVTPLLMMHNKKDPIVPWSQGIEFFIALRRLNKKVWMLQYDTGGHGVDGNDRIDYTIRMTQFFDHYLKAAPAPKWMTRGIPATLKGIDLGYELDKINEP